MEKAEDALSEALKAKVKAILDQPVSPRMFAELERFSRLAREMLSVSQTTASLGQQYGSLGNMVNPLPLTFQGVDGLIPSMPVQSSNSENFGASVIRELFSSLTGFKKESSKPNAIEAITAITLAKQRGLDDIAVKIQEEAFGISTPIGDIKPATELPELPEIRPLPAFLTGEQVRIHFPMSDHHGKVAVVESASHVFVTAKIDENTRHSGPPSDFQRVVEEFQS